MSDEIIPSLSLEALLSRRDAAIGCLESIKEKVAELRSIADAISFSGHSAAHKFAEPTAGGRYHQRHDFVDDAWLPWARASVDAALWEHLLDKSGLRSFLDAKAREEWDKQIESNKAPELTPDNIRATFRNLHEQRAEFFERGVIAIFKRLSWDYKSNRPQRFGSRLVVRYVTDPRFGGAELRTCSELDDLMRALSILDDKPEPDHRQGIYQNLSHHEARESREYVNDYIRIRTFKNGNGHVYMLRPDLVERLNLILAKHYPNALPPEAP